MLHPQTEAYQRLLDSSPDITAPGFDIEAERVRRRAAALDDAGPLDDGDDSVRVRELDADGITCRLYVPSLAEGNDPIPTLIYTHGGGFVFGDLITHDSHSRVIARATSCAVLTVDYRRPPEHRFPAAVDDVDTVTDWWPVHASDFGLDPTRTAVIGDSAGGNLAAVACLHHPGRFAATILVYPMVDPHGGSASYRTNAVGLTGREADWYWRAYADESDFDHPDLSILTAPRLDTMPPTYLVLAEHDPLHDEDRELADRLDELGVEVTVREFAGHGHGFWRYTESFDAASESLADVASWLARRR